jgi:hypothetical protein
MSLGIGNVVFQNQNPAGFPFVAGSAVNGLSIDAATGKVVLGNNVAAVLATLLSNREIPMSTFQLQLLWAAAQSLTFGALGSGTFINAVITNAATLQGYNVQHNVASVFTGYRSKNFNSLGEIEFDLANDLSNGLFINVLGSAKAGGNTTIFLVAGAEMRFNASTAAAFIRWQTQNTTRMTLLANGNLRVAANSTDNTCKIQADGAGSMDKLVFARNITPYAINLNQDRDNFFTNEGASALIVFNLPSAAANFTYTFYVQDVDGLQVTAAAGDTIRIASSVTAAAGNISSLVIGSCIKLQAINATEWVAVSVVGSWTI